MLFSRRHTGSRIDWRARPGGSAAYALAEAMGWQEGLERKAGDARGFYGVIAVSILAALAIQYLPISPMKALFWSAVINGVVAVSLMIVVILLASSRSVMGSFTSGWPIVMLGLDRDGTDGRDIDHDAFARLGRDAEKCEAVFGRHHSLPL
ncbi:divalent metal cation transporter [Mesorhizobium sp. CA5]|nr:divalent metal cation transporter [Mesorhizobium sp. CA5]